MTGGAPPILAELQKALDRLSESGEIEVREDGQWLAELASPQWELRHNGKNVLVHFWSDRRNLTRRVLAVAEESGHRITLEVQRFGYTKARKLELLRREQPRPAAQVAREQFRAFLRRLLVERFPDAEIASSTTARDLEHSFSDVYIRGKMIEGSRAWAFLAASPSESAAAIDGMLTFGILWLDWMRNRGVGRPIEGLRLFVPEGTGDGLCERTAVLSPRARTEVFELSQAGELRALLRGESGNLESRLFPRGEADLILAASGNAIARVRRLVPEAAAAIQPRVAPGARDVEFCFRGLRFARWALGEVVLFGLQETEQRLTEDSEPILERLIRRLDLHRNSLAEKTNHPLFRNYPERWLERLIYDDPTKLDAQLDPRFIYSQVPALAGRDQRVLDLVGITRRGRLVVIEVKASENMQLLMQAMDYWLRVRRHLAEGDFKRLGYFPGVEISGDSPLVCLVAPALRFHPSTDILLKYLAPEIRITRIGLSENWRHGIKVVLRQ